MTTRRDQIVNAWGIMPAGLSRASFIQGAEWADANPEAHNKYWIDRQNDLVKKLQTRDQAIELLEQKLGIALQALENIKTGFVIADTIPNGIKLIDIALLRIKELG